MDNSKTKRACGHLQFLKLLLSMGAYNTNSIFDSTRHGNQRLVKYSLSISMDEEYYQLCLDLGLQNLINKTQIFTAKKAENDYRQTEAGGRRQETGDKTPF